MSVKKVRVFLKKTSIAEKLIVSTPVLHKYSLLDVSDFSLFKSGYCLIKGSKNKILLVNHKHQDVELSYPSKGDERFWWDFPSKARRTLKPLLSYKALQEMTTANLRQWRFVMVCKGQHQDKKYDKPSKFIKFLLIQLNKGEYHEYFLVIDKNKTNQKKFVKYVKGINESLLEMPTLEKIRSVQGCIANELSLSASFQDKINKAKNGNQSLVGLSESLPSELTVRKACYSLMACARKNEQGIIDDIDTEYLHQYRVHLRKIRSLINLLKKCFSPDVYLDLKSRLSIIASRTNMLRDLDVFLLKQHIKSGSKNQKKKGLYSLLAKKRDDAYLELKIWLLSDLYEKEMTELINLLSKNPDYYNRFSKLSIGIVLQKMMLKKIRKDQKEKSVIS